MGRPAQAEEERALRISRIEHLLRIRCSFGEECSSARCLFGAHTPESGHCRPSRKVRAKHPPDVLVAFNDGGTGAREHITVQFLIAGVRKPQPRFCYENRQRRGQLFKQWVLSEQQLVFWSEI